MAMSKEQKRFYVIVGILIIIIILLWLGKIPTQSGSSGSAGSCSNAAASASGNGVDGVCSDGGKYHCYITCTNTPPPTIPKTYSCCSGGMISYTSSCYLGDCPAGYSLINTFNSQTECQAGCGTPRETPADPTDSFSCREYATDLGFDGSNWDVTQYNLADCQKYVQTNWCSVPTQVNRVSYCCMWSC